MGEQDPQHRAGLPRWIREVYEAPGFSGFTSIFANNPGASRAGTRSIALGNLGNDAAGLPVLLRDPSRLQPLAAPVLSFPFVPAINDSINAFYPDTGLSYTHCVRVGWQRQLGRNMIDKYIGNQNLGQTFEWNINGSENWNILENGFYQEFQKAQANLRANVAAGRTPSFRAYRCGACRRCRSSWPTSTGSR